MESKPSKVVVKRAIAEVKDLVKGKLFLVDAGSVTIAVNMSWDEGQSPTTDCSVFPNRKTPERLIKKFLGDSDSLWQEKYNKLIEKTSEYKTFAKRIKAACELADYLEKEFPNFDWSAKILDKALEVLR